MDFTDMAGHHLIQRCVIIQRDENGYGLTVTGDNPVYVQCVKDDGAAQRAGVQVGDRIIKVNGKVVTDLNHREVVDLIKSSSYVALTVMGKPPAAQNTHNSDSVLPGVQTDPSDRVTAPLPPHQPVVEQLRDEKTKTIQRMLEQERHFHAKIKEEYISNPSPKLLKELGESTTRLKALQSQLDAHTREKSSGTAFPYSPPNSPDPTHHHWSPSPSSHSSDSADSSSSRSKSSSYRPSSYEPQHNNIPGVMEPEEETPTPTSFMSSSLPSPSPSFDNSSYYGNSKDSWPLDTLPISTGNHHLRQNSSPDTLYHRNNELSSTAKDSKRRSLDTSDSVSSKHKYMSRPLIDKVDRSPSLPSPIPGDGSDNKLASSDYDQYSPVTTPPSEPSEKRSRSDTMDSSGETEPASSVSDANEAKSTEIIDFEDDFESEDERMEQQGPFCSLETLKDKPAHLAVFFNYLISNSDPSSMLFWMITDAYQHQEAALNDLKKWAYEIYSTFLDSGAPLTVHMDSGIVQGIEDVLSRNCSEDTLRFVFHAARRIAAEYVSELLADFRNKIALGLGSLFQAHLLDDTMDKSREMKVLEEQLLLQLEEIIKDIDSSGSESEANSRNLAMASALTTVMKQVGFNKSGSTALERFPSFAQRESKGKLFKLRPTSKKVKNHTLVITGYTQVTYCDHCGKLIWGAGNQGYQCTMCEMNCHKYCAEQSLDECTRKKKVKQRKMSGIQENIKQSQSSVHVSTAHINIQPIHPKEDKEVRDSSRHQSPVQEEYPGTYNDINSKRGDISDSTSNTSGFQESSFSDGEPEKIRLPSDTIEETSLGYRLKTRDFIKKNTSLVRAETFNIGDVPRSQKKRQTSVSFKKPNDESMSGLEAYKSASRGLESPTGLDTLSEGDPSKRSVSRSNFSYFPSDAELDSDMEVETETPNWQDTVDKKVLKKLKSKDIKRQEVINELIHTEKTHVRTLKVLDLIFEKPMRNANIMPYAQINKLFPNLAKLIEIHDSLLTAMKKRQEESQVINNIGDIILDRFENENGEEAKLACNEFCMRQKFALDYLRQKQLKDRKLHEFIQHCESHHLCRRLKLTDIISASYQRLTKYPLLLEAILKPTPTSHPDYMSLQRAIVACKNLLHYVNSGVKEEENKMRLAEIQKKIDKRPIENSNNKGVEEYKNLDITTKNLIYDGPLTWRISRNKSIDLHVLLLNDILVLLQKQDEKYVLKCQSTTMTTLSQDTKTTHSPIIKLVSVLIRAVATDKRAFFLVVSSSSVGPQIYELVAATANERKNWYKYIAEAAEALKGKDRGRRGAMSFASSGITPSIVHNDDEFLTKRITKKEPVILELQKDNKKESEEEESAKETNGIRETAPERSSKAEKSEEEEDEDEDDKDKEEEEEEDVEDEEVTEKVVETSQEAQAVDSEPEFPPPPPYTEYTSDFPPPPYTETLDENDIRISVNEDRIRSLEALTNEESVDDKLPPPPPDLDRFNDLSLSESDSSETVKLRKSGKETELEDSSSSADSARASIELLEQLRAKDEDLKKILEDKAKIVAELRGTPMTKGLSTSESTVSDTGEARDFVLNAILQANHLTVAVSDILNPEEESQSQRGHHSSGRHYLNTSSDEPPISHQQLVHSMYKLNEILTTLLSVITERDMQRERLRCDLQFANAQIQRLKQVNNSNRTSQDMSSQASEASLSPHSSYYQSQTEDDYHSILSVTSETPRSDSPSFDLDKLVVFSDLLSLNLNTADESRSGPENGQKIQRSSSFTCREDKNTLGGYLYAPPQDRIQVPGKQQRTRHLSHINSEEVKQSENFLPNPHELNVPPKPPPRKTRHLSHIRRDDIKQGEQFYLSREQRRKELSQTPPPPPPRRMFLLSDDGNGSYEFESDF